jgi:carbon storage regulator
MLIRVTSCEEGARRSGRRRTGPAREVGQENGDPPMLVLSRKQQEAVVVGGTVGFERLLKVTVLEIRGRNVKLGFEVDAGVPVHRWEVWERIRAAVQPGPPTGEVPAC